MAKRKPITIEYIIKSSPIILFEFLSEPAELEQWFADKVDEENDVYTFTWDGYPQVAQLTEWIENEKVVFTWDESGEYFSFEVQISNVTKETVLYITEFCDDNPKAEKDLRLLWDRAITSLINRIGGH